MRKPVLAIYLPRSTPRHSEHFPPPILMAASFPVALILIRRRAGRGKRLPLVLASLALTALIFAGCGSSGSTAIPTPIGVYSLTVTGNAVDASGNPLNASRPLAFTLDVIALGS